MDSELSAWHPNDNRDWRREPTLRDPERFARIVDSAFYSVGRDRNGSLSKSEIEEYLRTPDARGQVRDAFEVLHRNHETLANLAANLWSPAKFDRKDIAAFKAATADSVLDKSFYPKSIAIESVSFAALGGALGMIYGALTKGRTGIAYGALGLHLGAGAGAVSGFIDAWNTRQNRETLKSLDYFKLKETTGKAMPATP